MKSELPLSGVRVIELCWVWSGPLLGQMLADLGAEVIKVEWFKRYDLYRTRGVERQSGTHPESVRREMSQSFHNINRNKIGVTLDLKRPAHRDALLALARTTDLVIENFTAGTLQRLGVGYEELSEANPAIVLLSLAAFGSASALGEMRAYGLALSSLSGLESRVLDPLSGDFLGSPTFVASDPNAATYGLPIAIASVLDARRTGKGAHVEVSQLEAAAHVSADDDPELVALAQTLGMQSALSSDTSSIIQTGDGQYLCVQWIGRMTEAAFELLRDSVKTLPAVTALELFKAAGARAVKVIEKPSEFGAGAAKDDTLLQSIHTVTGPEQIVAAPWRIDGRRPPIRKPAPTLGEGNGYVLGKLLGWSHPEYSALAQEDQEHGRAKQ
jgi:crotonobetainyl-CoA:carnitine CoA-transferase CaiB-like acyl-CoA transferase